MFLSDSVRRRIARPVLVLAVAGGFLAVTALPASATVKGPQNLTVSCNMNIPKTGVTVTQRLTGTFKIRQNFTSPNSTSVVWAVDGQGHSLPTRTIGNGQTATWTNVLHARYTVHVHRVRSANCNGFLPGDGNYNWNYTVTFRG